MSLPIRVSSLEPGKKRVMNIDAAAGQRRAHLGREDLQVAGEHNDLNIEFDNGGKKGVLEPSLVVARRNGLASERDTVKLDKLAERLVIGEHERDVDRKLPRVLSEQQVIDAVPGDGG